MSDLLKGVYNQGNIGTYVHTCQAEWFQGYLYYIHAGERLPGLKVSWSASSGNVLLVTFSRTTGRESGEHGITVGVGGDTQEFGANDGSTKVFCPITT